MGSLLQKLFWKSKKLKLEFCQNNLDRFLDQDTGPLFEEFFNKKAISLKEFECLSHCERCKEKPYVIANGKLIHADGSMDIVGEIESTISV